MPRSAAAKKDQQRLHDAIESAAPGVSHEFVIQVLGNLFQKTPTNGVTCEAFLALESRCSLDWLRLHEFSPLKLDGGLDGEFIIAEQKTRDEVRAPPRPPPPPSSAAPSSSLLLCFPTHDDRAAPPPSACSQEWRAWC